MRSRGRLHAHAGSRGDSAIDHYARPEAFGLTFQQVQKYESGMNRMGSSRLQQAASILGVPVSYFFEGGDGGPFKSASNLSPSYVDDFVASEDGLRLALRQAQMESRELKRHVFLLCDCQRHRLPSTSIPALHFGKRLNSAAHRPELGALRTGGKEIMKAISLAIALFALPPWRISQ